MQAMFASALGALLGSRQSGSGSDGTDFVKLHNDFLSAHRNELSPRSGLFKFPMDQGRHDRKEPSSIRQRFGVEEDLANLRLVPIEALQQGLAQGKFIRGKLVVEPFAQAGLVTVIQDAKTGATQRLSVYNAQRAAAAATGKRESSADPADVLLVWFAQGREIAVREPYLKIANDGYPLVRVDSPGDIVFLSAPAATGGPSPAGQPDARPASDARPRGRKKAGKKKQQQAARVQEGGGEAAGPRESDPDDAEALSAKAAPALGREDFVEAERLYGLAMAREPGAAKYASNRAHARLKLGRFVAAYEDAAVAARLDPRWHRPPLRMGEALREQLLFEPAKERYEKALALLANNAAGASASTLEADRAVAEKGLSACNAALSRASTRMDDSKASLDACMRRKVREMQARAPAIARALEKATAEQRALFEMTGRAERLVAEARAARQRGDFALQLATLRRAAAMGSPMAMNDLWVALSGGGGTDPPPRGAPLDFEEAHRWLQEAVEKPAWILPGLVSNPGVSEALNATGVALRDAIGQPVDHAAAARWFRRAAETGTGDPGHLCGLCNIGTCYMRGQGVERDAAEAARWFRIGAEEFEYAPAQVGLGDCYAGGEGVPRDVGRARALYRAAAAQSLPMAAERLALLEGEPRAAFDAWLAAAEGGLPEAAHAVAAALLAGNDGAPRKDEAAGRAWLDRAAAKGYAPSMLALARLLQRDALGAPDAAAAGALSKRAASLLLAAAEQGDVESMVAYADAVVAGDGVPADREGARRFLNRARKAGSKEAERRLERMGAGESGGSGESMREQLRAWEAEHPPPAGATLEERIDRVAAGMAEKAAAAGPEVAAAVRAVAGARDPPIFWKGLVPPDAEDPFELSGLEAAAAAGSGAAARLARARRPRDAGLALLERARSTGEVVRGVRLLAEAARLDETVLRLPAALYPPLLALLQRAIEEAPEDPTLHLFELMLRLPERSAAETARRAAQLAGPLVTDPHTLAACAAMRMAAGDPRAAVATLERARAAAARGAGGCDPTLPARLLYDLGAARVRIDPRDEAAVRAGVEELRAHAAAAPPDDRLVSAAHFQAALALVQLGEPEAAAAERARGVAAAARRLPAFGPEETAVKRLLDALLPAALLHRRPRAAAACAHCGAAGAEKACGLCRTEVYCGRACQRAHWKQHKAACSKAAAAGAAPSEP